MRVLTGILRELAGLFVDDGWLAIAILGVVALAAVVAALTPAGSLAAGVVLACGLLAVNALNRGGLLRRYRGARLGSRRKRKLPSAQRSTFA
jgi:hypothetical protein